MKLTLLLGRYVAQEARGGVSRNLVTTPTRTHLALRRGSRRERRSRDADDPTNRPRNAVETPRCRTNRTVLEHSAKRRCVQPDEPSSRLDPLRHGDGLPAGIMLVGSRGDDETVLALASQFEPLGLSDEDSFAAPPSLIITIIGWGLIPTDPQFQVASHNKNERD